MKGVMMLVNYFPPLPTGGAERQAERLAAYMAAQNVSTGVLTRRIGDLPKRERRDGFEVYRLPQLGPGKMKTFTFTLAAIQALLKRQQSYDILHAHLAFSPAIAAALTGKLLGKRVIVKFGNSAAYGDVQRSRRSWRGRLRMAILRRWADIIVTLDPEMETEAIADGFARERVLRMDNGIDAAEFVPCFDKSAARQALGLENRTTILYTGRLAEQKALPVLLLALRQTLDSCPDLQLVLLGHGEEKPRLAAQAEALGLGPHVIFRDPVADVRPYLDAADIFVLPSLAEGISNSLLEAMSAGLACIASRVGGSPVVLEDGRAGLVVEPGSAGELAEALVRLASSPEERARLGIQARQRIQSRYDFKVVGRQYHALYEHLLEKA
ncbi:MAG: glycosyltransferase family 4 protein [Chloroflexota bacterium]